MKIDTTIELDRIHEILSTNRIWSVYALADLDPEHRDFNGWYRDDHSLLLKYSGITPPVLFFHGDPHRLGGLLKEIPPGTYQISFPSEAVDHLRQGGYVIQGIPMWRMYLDTITREYSTGRQAHPLFPNHIEQIEALIGDQADAPDGFHPRQLNLGPFSGIWESSRLVSMAGVHVLSKHQSIAAIGNVYTHRNFRGKGYAVACTRQVLEDLNKLGIELIVLNVSQENQRAVSLYQHLGFQIHGPFYEGQITVYD